MPTATTTKKVALITGANKGIGYETARQLGRLGYVVYLGARDEQRGRAAADALRGEGSDARFVKLDVANPADHAAARDVIDREFGRLDVLVNNAGIAPGQDVKTSETTPGLLRETFDTNFFGVVSLTNALLGLIRRSDAGRIVNLSSGLGSLTQHSDPAWPFYHFKPLAYDASKTALNAYTVHLAYELRDTPIKVNSADPGWVKTDMGGQAAHLEVAEGAATGVRLATLGPDGPTGAFFHKDERLPW